MRAPVPDYDHSSPRPTADEGTHLGASTNFLTRLFAFAMLPITTARRGGRTIASALARIFGGDHRLLRRLGAIATSIGGALGRAWHGVTSGIRRVAAAAARLLAPIGAIFRSIARAWRRVWRIVFDAIERALRAIGHAITIVVRPIARVVAKLWTALARAVATAWNAVAHVSSVIWGAVIRPVTAVRRALWRLAVTVWRAVASTIARWARRVGTLIAPLLRPALRGLGTAIGAVFWVCFWPIGWLVRLLGRVIKAIATVLGPPVRAVTDRVRRIGERITLACRRGAHSVGVAYLRARLMNAHVAAPTNDARTAPIAPRPPRTIPFEAAVFQNEWLPQGGRDVHAVITVTAHATPSTDSDSPPEAAEVILLDCSGSMGHPWQKLRAARHATAAAIDTLRDGTWFAIVRASHVAEPVYPMGGGLVRATDQTRLNAISALGLLWPEGGTAMGQWLTLARDLLDTQPHAIPHAVLLTDGKNESETPAELEAALKEVAGRFQCDCRGVGTDWDVGELRTVSSRMLGTVDIVADPNDLAADFEAMAASAMAKRVGHTRLRVWTPVGAVVHSLHQVAPEIQDLTMQRRPVDRLTGEYATGSWGDESRDYHLCVRVPDKGVGAEMLAARVSLLLGDHVATSSLVRAIWTDDEEAATRISPQVAHYTGQSELASLIQDGVGARRAGDEELATEKLGRAARVAAASGNDETLKLLANVVDIVDAPTGQVRLKAKVELADEMALDTRSAKTVRVAQ
jgi:hypothetical protein